VNQTGGNIGAIAHLGNEWFKRHLNGGQACEEQLHDTLGPIGIDESGGKGSRQAGSGSSSAQPLRWMGRVDETRFGAGFQGHSGFGSWVLRGAHQTDNAVEGRTLKGNEAQGSIGPKPVETQAAATDLLMEKGLEVE